MGAIAVVIVAVLVLSAGSQLHLSTFARFIVVAIPLNFVLHRVGDRLLKRIASARFSAEHVKHLEVFGTITPELAAQAARDPIFNAAKFLFWMAKWCAVVAAGLALAR